MYDLLLKTAWPMTPQRPYSLFHITFTVIGVILAVLLARILSGSLKDSDKKDRVLFVCGLILAVFELYKQLFIYYVVGGGSYDWWYFPFQICSTPMYLCLLVPFTGRWPAVKKALCTYLQDFALLGGIMALLEPSGLLEHPYVTLTLHALSWHIILIFIGLYSGMSSLAGHTLKDFISILPVFAVGCVTATVINVLAGPRADMFYISPYYPNTQIVFHEIAVTFGITAGNAVYLAGVCIGAWLMHLLMRFITDHGRKL